MKLSLKLSHMTQGRDSRDVCQVADHIHRLPGVLHVSEPEVAVDNLDAALDKLWTKQAGAGDLGQGLLLLGLHEEAFADTSLVVIEVDDEVGEGCEPGHGLAPLGSDRGFRNIFGRDCGRV